jgi:hypothetical protein
VTPPPTTTRTTSVADDLRGQSNIRPHQKQQSYFGRLTPDQIEQQNKGYLVWRDCMIAEVGGIPDEARREGAALLAQRRVNGQGRESNRLGAGHLVEQRRLNREAKRSESATELGRLIVRNNGSSGS